MAKGIFTKGFTVQEVLNIQNRAKALLLEGKTVMNYADSGTSVGKQFAMPVAETLEECSYALAVLAPGAYGSTVPKRIYGTRWNRGPFIH